ncbi:MAG: carboxy terminal-processing peptidase [Acidobacteria bacterium]|nr:carboxy terminal-processing peptidase [Acidobacteriota bacterium]MCB9396866.1 carboxy terminal-processing peptidase [Acidobacteriota bacterium]
MLRGIVLLGCLVSGAIYDSTPHYSKGPYQAELTRLVTSYLAYYHYSRKNIDDEISAKAFHLFLENLDANKLFFLQSDIDEFKKYELAIDDDLESAESKLEIPFNVYERYAQRVDERVQVALKYIKSDFDFNKDESMVLDREDMPWAKSKAELDEIWRMRIKDQIIRFLLQDRDKEYYTDLLSKRYERLAKEVRENDSIDILERFLSSVTRAYDPHSQYLKPATKDNFDIDMGHSLEGIGATLRNEGEYTIVVDLIPGGPAALSGKIKPNDKIIAVGQGDEEPVDVVDLRIDKVVKQIRGKKGTEVRLTIVPATSVDMSDASVVSLIRDKVIITSQDAKKEVHEIKDSQGRNHKFGVINVPGFYLDSNAKYNGEKDFKSTTRDVRKLLKELEGDKIEGLVIDLRNNSGGSLDEAVELSGLFIKKGPIVQVRAQDGDARVLDDPDPAQVYDGPLVVLTNVFSASASEIFAGAIQDYRRGIVVGDQATHGKGTVQKLIGLEPFLRRLVDGELPDNLGGALKLTTHKFYRVSGSSTQLQGVRADIPLPSVYDQTEFRESKLENALNWDQIKPVEYDRYQVSADMVAALRLASEKRVTVHPEFAYVREDAKHFSELRAENRVSLNLAKRKAEKTQQETLDEQRKKERQVRNPVEVDKDKKVETGDAPDFVLQEAIEILNDYRLFQNGQSLATAQQETVPNRNN